MALNANEKRNLKMKEIAGKAARYIDASEKIKPLDAEKKKLSSELKESAEAFGTEDTNAEGEGTGTFSLELNGFVVKKIAVKSAKIDHVKAVPMLRKLGLLERCTSLVVNDKALEVAFQEGLIDIETINSFTTETEGTPRVSVERA